MPTEIDQTYPSDETNVAKQPKRRLVRLLLWSTAFALATAALLYFYTQHLNTAPANFPVGEQVEIAEGADVRTITKTLATRDVVRSADLLYYILVLFHDPTSIKASTYIFDEPYDTLTVARRLTEGDFDTDLVRFTHIEGERATQLATRAAEILPNFSRPRFLAAAEPLEGRLYPETYFIPADYSDEQLLTLMLETFSEKTAPLQTEIDASTLTLDEILVLASIIEREANTPESMKLVSSVLQNRLEIGMALQADASIEYVLEKPLSELTAADLEIDSPYNTYLYPGLPPTPIGNPGLEAIEAVLAPAESDYFYYITDNEGVFHYAKTYNEHLINIEKYLR